MVFFTCNACGESLKRAQVDKHLNICRHCQCLSCIDCGKDFWGDDYKTHLKCISEDQKYGGKSYEAKSNKGDVKQQQWIQKIHEAVNKPGISPKLREVLSQVSSYDNVPRKKGKFQNWMKNSLRISNTTLYDQVWEIFSAATSNQSQSQEGISSQPEECEDKVLASVTEDSTSSSDKKKNKRERKEERQKKNKKEKKVFRLEKQEEEDNDQALRLEPRDEDSEEELEGRPTENQREKKKGKHKLATPVEVNGTEHIKAGVTSKKCKKRKHDNLEDNQKSKQMKMETEDDVECDNESKGKFNWKGTIKSILKQNPEDGISVKKLRKKVLAAYYAFSGEGNHKSEEELLSLFKKKISNNPKFRVLKDKVTLVK
ncbi:LYAR protein, partial [Atractosteus spatula]|nr:LYAR protein [Atractosteus spatula]